MYYGYHDQRNKTKMLALPYREAVSYQMRRDNQTEDIVSPHSEGEKAIKHTPWKKVQVLTHGEPHGNLGEIEHVVEGTTRPPPRPRLLLLLEVLSMA